MQNLHIYARWKYSSWKYSTWAKHLCLSQGFAECCVGREGQQRRSFWRNKQLDSVVDFVDLSSLLLLNVSAAAICEGADLHYMCNKIMELVSLRWLLNGGEMCFSSWMYREERGKDEREPACITKNDEEPYTTAEGLLEKMHICSKLNFFTLEVNIIQEHLSWRAISDTQSSNETKWN